MSSIADMLNGISDIINGVRTKDTPTASPIPKIPDQMIDGGIIKAPVLGTEWARQLSTQIPQFVEQISAFPTDAYNLVNSGLQWATGADKPVLPGVEGAREVSDSIHDVGQNVTEWMLDEPRNTSLLHGTPPELMGNWAGLAASALARAPAAITTKIDEGMKLLEAGKGLAARTGEYSAKALEMVTPVMVRTPTKAVEAGSLGVGAGLGVGVELAFPDPDIARIDAARQQAATTAFAGAETAAPDVKTVQDAVNPIPAGFSTGNTWLDAAVLGAGALGMFAFMKRDAMRRIMGAMGKEEDTVLKASEALRTNIVDRTEPIKTAYGTIHPEFKDRFANLVDESHGAAIDTKLRSVFDSGEIPNSMVKMPAVRDLFTKMGKAGEEAIDIAERAISSRRDYYDTASRSVRGAVDRAADWNLAQANPLIKDIVEQYDTTVKRMLDYAVEQGGLTRVRANEIISEGLHQFPKRLGDDLNLKTPNSPKVADNIFSMEKPLRELPVFIEKTMRDVEWNKVQRSLITEMRAAAASGNKFAQEVLGRPNVSRKNTENAVAFRGFDGKVDTQEILDPLIKRALTTGSDTARLHALSGNMAWLSRQFEQFATGKYATAALQPFSPIAAMYNAGFGAALRPPGVKAGIIDAGLQNAGFKFGLPGDPTLIAHAVGMAGKGAYGVVVKRMADILHSSVLRDGIIAKAIGEDNANKMATALTNQYKQNWIHTFQTEGLLGPAAYMGHNPDQMIKQAISAMQPAGLPKRVLRETLGFLDDITHAISASPTASIWALNSNLPHDLRARAVREFTGDPSRGGAFVGKLREGQLPGESIGKLTAATPWGNIYLQSMDKFARSFSNPKQAMSSLTGMSVAVGLPVIAVANWNASLGPEYSDYQYNKRTPDRKAASIYFGLPGVAPENGLEIPVDPVMRPYKLAMELLTGAHLGLLDGSLFAPENESTRSAYASMARNSWFKDVPLSVIEQSALPPLPVAGTAGAAAFGINWRSYINSNEIHRRNDAGYTDSDAANPFRSVFGLSESAVAENIIRSLGANSGAMLYDLFMNSAQRINEDAPVAKNAWQTIKLGASDTAKPVSGLLFGSFASVSPSQEAAGRLVQEKVKGLQHLTKALDAVTTNGALDGGEIVGSKQRGFQALLGGRMAVEPNDPRMLEASSFAKQQLQLISQQFLGANKDDYAQRSSLQANTQYSPERRRAMMNELAGQITERNRQLLTLLQQFESQMSSRYGVHMQLDKLDVGSSKGMDQFSE
jgi:hypothetical protein